MIRRQSWSTAKAVVSAILLVTATAVVCAAQEPKEMMALPDGLKLNLASTCPVCGMRVGGDLPGGATYSYRDGNLVGFGGAAAAVFKDGHVVGFEGARCLFIYNTVPKRFGIDVGNIVKRYVTDFDTRKMIDVNQAFFVLGSSVKGPMGYELVGFSSKEKAEDFKTRYNGKRIVQMQSVGLKDVERKGGVLKIKP